MYLDALSTIVNHCHNLKSLSLNGLTFYSKNLYGYDSTALEIITCSTSLTHLDFGGHIFDISRISHNWIRFASQLRDLNLNSCRFASEESLFRILQPCSNLINLSLLNTTPSAGDVLFSQVYFKDELCFVIETLACANTLVSLHVDGLLSQAFDENSKDLDSKSEKNEQILALKSQLFSKMKQLQTLNLYANKLL